MLPQILILSEKHKDINSLHAQIEGLNYSVLLQEKSSKFTNLLHDNQIILLNSEGEVDQNLNLINAIHKQISHLPVIAVGAESKEIPIKIAQATVAIIKMPTTNVLLKKRLARYIEPQKSLDCRVHTRVAAQLEIKWNHVGSRIHQEGEIENISVGGAFVTEDHLFPKKGDVLNFVIQSEGLQPLAGKGIVRWLHSKALDTSRPGFGIEFLSVPDKALFKTLGL